MPISADVPPISKVISLSRPAWAPTQSPPSTPAASPDISVSAGFSRTIRAVATPPLDAMMRNSPRTPMPCSAASSRVT